MAIEGPRSNVRGADLDGSDLAVGERVRSMLLLEGSSAWYKYMELCEAYSLAFSVNFFGRPLFFGTLAGA